MNKKVYSLNILCPDFECCEIVSELFVDLGYANGIKSDNGEYTAQVFMHNKPDSSELMARIRAIEDIWGEGVFEVWLNDLSAIDWTIKNQISQKPYSAGKFFIYQDIYTGQIPSDKIPVLVNPANAFGIGSHPTTLGCLTAISQLPNKSYANIIDVGTGTGVLAVAMAKFLTFKNIIATDIDSTAIKACKQTMALNNITTIKTICATGLNHQTILTNTYDLAVVNILTNILIDISADILAVLNNNATLILSGIDRASLPRVISCYNNLGFKLNRQYIADWCTLVMKK